MLFSQKADKRGGMQEKISQPAKVWNVTSNESLLRQFYGCAQADRFQPGPCPKTKTSLETLSFEAITIMPWRLARAVKKSRYRFKFGSALSKIQGTVMYTPDFTSRYVSGRCHIAWQRDYCVQWSTPLAGRVFTHENGFFSLLEQMLLSPLPENCTVFSSLQVG